MNIKREIVTSVMIDDERELKIGDYAVFIANDVCMCGMFKGLTKRGCLSFYDKIGGMEKYFNVMPSSIIAIDILRSSEVK